MAIFLSEIAHLPAQSGEGLTLDYGLAQNNRCGATSGIFPVAPFAAGVAGHNVLSFFQVIRRFCCCSKGFLV
jgi:hypothetical protein